MNRFMEWLRRKDHLGIAIMAAVIAAFILSVLVNMAASAQAPPRCTVPAIVNSGRLAALILPADLAKLSPDRQLVVKESLLNTGNADVSAGSPGRKLLTDSFKGTTTLHNLQSLFNAYDRAVCP